MQMFSGGSRWTLYKGAQINDSSVVGTFDKGKPSTAEGVKAVLTGSKGAEIALKLASSGFWASIFGKEECELQFQGQAVAKVCLQTLAAQIMTTTMM